MNLAASKNLFFEQTELCGVAPTRKGTRAPNPLRESQLVPPGSVEPTGPARPAVSAACSCPRVPAASTPWALPFKRHAGHGLGSAAASGDSSKCDTRREKSCAVCWSLTSLAAPGSPPTACCEHMPAQAPVTAANSPCRPSDTRRKQPWTAQPQPLAQVRKANQPQLGDNNTPLLLKPLRFGAVCSEQKLPDTEHKSKGAGKNVFL